MGTCPLCPLVKTALVDSICGGRRSSDDRGQFITLNVYLCVQHDAREKASRVRNCMHRKCYSLSFVMPRPWGAFSDTAIRPSVCPMAQAGALGTKLP